MCTPLIDLDYALRFIKSDYELSKYPLFLFGHSWGGYAVTSVLSIHSNVKACAAVAPFNSGYTLIAEKGEQYAGPVATALPKIFLDVYQKILFKDYTKYTGVKGINSTNIPVLIAHGMSDAVISFDGQSIISHQREIRTENVYYYLGKDSQSGHNTILHSKRAVEYQNQIKRELKELKKQKGKDITEEDLEVFCQNVNHSLYSEVNEELMNQILDMYDKCL